MFEQFPGVFVSNVPNGGGSSLTMKKYVVSAAVVMLVCDCGTEGKVCDGDEIEESSLQASAVGLELLPVITNSRVSNLLPKVLKFRTPTPGEVYEYQTLRNT